MSYVGLVVAAALLCLAYGCAKPGPPGGGPADELPPEVVATRPADGDVNVDLASTIEIEFSEEMSRQPTERSLTVTPELDLRNFRWRGRTLIAEPIGVLPDTTTIVVRVGEVASDYHGVAVAAPHQFAFSTGGVIDLGVMSGSVTARGQPVAGAVVWACLEPVVPDSAGVVRACGYTSVTDADGAFRIGNVRAAARPYAVVAFIDRDGDGRYSLSEESGRVLLEAAFLAAPEDSIGGIEIPLRDATEDGVDAPGETGGPERTGPAAEPDTLDEGDVPREGTE